jgi:hypothetical protein
MGKALQETKAVRGGKILLPGIAWLQIWIWLAGSGGAIIPRQAAAQAPPSQEYQVKAAFLFNFAQFITWPTNAFTEVQSPLVIGILGTDPFGSVLDEIVRGEKANGHPLVVQRYRQIEEARGCHILFISESENKRVEDIFIKLKGRNILTVGDTDEFARRGGMIRFFTEKGKLRLLINPGATQQAGLEVSSRLLRLAKPAAGEAK